MRDGDMLAMLERAERALVEGLYPYTPEVGGFLADADGWHTLDVNYEPPRVERLWREFEDGRLYLHRIHPCEKALYHPHPWPSAVKILSGSYQMAVGYYVESRGDEGPSPPPYASLQVLTAGATYEMIRPGGWHYVKPLGGTSYSIMVTGPKWDGVWSPKATHKLDLLADGVKAELLRAFRHFYKL